MISSQAEFEQQYHGKKVRPKGIIHTEIPIKDYVVTAALFEYEGEESIFAIQSEDYLETNHWFTIRFPNRAVLNKNLEDFEIL